MINKLQGGLMNKFGRGPANDRRVCKAIDGAAIGDLGGPLRLALVRLFGAGDPQPIPRSPRRLFAPLPQPGLRLVVQDQLPRRDLAVMHQEGAMAEVVSEMEYAKARAWACPANRSSSTAPTSRGPRLERAVAEGAAVNVDHLDEICDLEEIADASWAAKSRSGSG